MPTRTHGRAATLTALFALTALGPLTAAGVFWTAYDEEFQGNVFAEDARWSRGPVGHNLASVTSGAGNLTFSPDGRYNTWARFDCEVGPVGWIDVRGRVTPSSSPSYATTPTLQIHYADGNYMDLAMDGTTVHLYVDDRDGVKDRWVSTANHTQRHGDWSTTRLAYAPTRVVISEDPEGDGTFRHVGTFSQNQSADGNVAFFRIMQTYDAAMEIDWVVIAEKLVATPADATAPMGQCGSSPNARLR